jgi:uncharacterized phosphosugar-binding protein
MGAEPNAFMTAARALLERLESQADAVEEASRICAAAIGAGGLVHCFGTGHSRIPVEELFPRYGSYPGFNPIVELSTTFHTQVVGANGQRQAMAIERAEGLAASILANFRLAPPDAGMVFSAGGTTAVPIEVATGMRDAGLAVIAVTSVEHSRASASRHSSGTRLLDHADVVLDLCTPVGDALVDVDGARVGPGSTVAAVVLANAVKVLTAELLAADGALPPVLSAASLVGEEESRRLFDAGYAEHARRYAAVLRTEP